MVVEGQANLSCYVTVMAGSSATATPTATDSATATPVSPTPTETVVDGSSPTPTATSTAPSGATPTATRTVIRTATPIATTVQSATTTPTASATTAATNTPTLIPTVTDTPLPTGSPTPLQSPTPEPLATKAPALNPINNIVGVLQSISVDTVWTSGNVYTITGVITVNTGVRLYIQPGVVIQFGTVNGQAGKLVVNGVLNAQGTADNRIIFTSMNDDRFGSDATNNGDSTWVSHGAWSGLLFNVGSSGSQLNHVLVAGAGRAPEEASITVNGANVNLLNSEVQVGGSSGLLWKDNASGQIVGNVINLNLLSGIVLKTGATPLIASNTIVHNRKQAIYQEGNSFPTLHDNIVYGNGINGIGVVGTIGTGQWYVNPNLPYVMLETVSVGPPSKLTLPAGLVVKFQANTTMIVRGALHAVGNQAAPIVFTSLKNDRFGGDTQQDGAATKPIAGDWGSLYFADTANDAESVLDYVRISYGGGGYLYGTDTTYADLAVDSASPLIQNSLFEQSAQYGVQMLNVSSSLFQNNRLEYNLSHALWISADSDPDILNNTFWHNGGFATYIVGSSSAFFQGSWAKGNRVNGIGMTGIFNDNMDLGRDMPYVVDVSLTVGQGVTLDIQPGAVVKFTPQAKITVNGTLLADGTAEEPIWFTSLKDDSIIGDTNGDNNNSVPAPGDWESILFTGFSSNSSLAHVIVRYGGSNAKTGALMLYESAPTLNYLTVMGNHGNGIYVQSAAPLIQNSFIGANGTGVYNDSLANTVITNSTFIGNQQFAVNNFNATLTVRATYNYWGDDDGPQHSSNPSGNGDAVTDWVAYAPYLTASPITLPAPLPTFPAPLTYTQVSGVIVNNTTWKAALNPYLVVGDVTVNPGVQLRIEPGVILKFSDGKSLIVNGILDAVGTPSQRIIFTSAKDDTVGGDSNGDKTATWPRPGDWGRLYFGDSSADPFTRLKYAELRFAGKKGSAVLDGIFVDSASPTLEENLVVQNAGYGLHLRNQATPTLRRNLILDNQSGGVFLEQTSAGLFDSNQFWGNSGYAVYMDGSCYPTFVGNLPHYNENNGARIAGSMTFNQTWRPNLTYVIDQPLTVQAGAQLSLQPGLVVKFASTNSNLIINGSLVATGTVDNPTYFTSLNDDSIGGDTNNDDGAMWPLSGDWGRILFADSSNDATTLLDGVDVGYGSDGMITTQSSAPHIANSLIHSAYGFAMHIYNQANPLIEYNTITGNSGGAAKVWDNSFPIFRQNQIYNNSGVAFDVTADSKVIMDHNDLGDNGVNAIKVTGTLNSYITWDVNDPPLPYAPGNITIAPGAKLTLPAGAVLKFLDGAAWTINGQLSVEGDSIEPVIMTSIHDDTVLGDSNSDGSNTTPKEGNWQSLVFNSGANGSYIGHTIVRYGGLPTFKIVQAQIDIHDSTFDTNRQALWLDQGTTELDHLLFVNNTEYAIYSKNSALTLHDSSFAGNQRGLYLRNNNTTAPILVNNVFTNNKEYAFDVDVNSFYLVAESNQFTSTVGNSIVLSTGTLTRETTRFYKDRIYQLGTVTAPPGVIVTIDPGAIFKFPSTNSTLLVQGELNAGSTSGAAVIFTSFADDTVVGDTNFDQSETAPAPGDWKGIELGDNATASFANVILRYGGRSKAIINVPKNGTLVLDSCTVSDSKTNGISMNSSFGGFYVANLTVTASSISNNQTNGILMDAYEKKTEPGAGAGQNNFDISDSILADNGSNGIKIDLADTAMIHSSDIYGNFLYGIDADDNAPVLANGNWWGDPSGPYDVDEQTPAGMGEKISKMVVVTTWENAPLHPVLSAAAAAPESSNAAQRIYLPVVISH